jgi:hypothetical protein
MSDAREKDLYWDGGRGGKGLGAWFSHTSELRARSSSEQLKEDDS